MMDLGVLEQSRANRAMREVQVRRARRLRFVRNSLLGLAVGLVALLLFMASVATSPRFDVVSGGRASSARAAERSSYGLLAAGTRLHQRFKMPLRSGMLFDVRTGRVLWARAPGAILPIASL